MAADSSIRAKEFRIKVAESGNVLEIQGEGGLDCTREFLDAFNAGESTALTAAVNAAIASEVTNRNAAIAAQHTVDNATYAQGGGSAKIITGTALLTLPAGTEYVWIKTDGAGAVLDILSGVA